MTSAQLVSRMILSEVDIARHEAKIDIGGRLVPVADFVCRDKGKGWIVPASPLYTQADLDAAREEAYRQGVSDARAGIEQLEP